MEPILKSAGGWSLEMIDTRYPFFDKGNWTASLSRKGGTPGIINSADRSNPDVLFNGLQNVFPEDSSELSVMFSEPLFGFPSLINNVKVDREGTCCNLFCRSNVQGIQIKTGRSSIRKI